MGHENGETAPAPDYDDVAPMYANNVRFEMSAWDIRLFFGQLMPGATNVKAAVDWHTDVTIPWAQAKLMHLYLGINVALHEADNGKIRMPAGVLPPPVATPPEGIDINHPQEMAKFEMVQKMINEFREAELNG